MSCSNSLSLSLTLSQTPLWDLSLLNIFLESTWAYFFPVSIVVISYGALTTYLPTYLLLIVYLSVCVFFAFSVESFFYHRTEFHAINHILLESIDTKWLWILSTFFENILPPWQYKIFSLGKSNNSFTWIVFLCQGKFWDLLLIKIELSQRANVPEVRPYYYIYHIICTFETLDVYYKAFILCGYIPVKRLQF